MNTDERAPSADELAAMAYADGELDVDARRAFEARMQTEPALAREVAALKRLAVMAREAAGPEPMDIEWQRIAQQGVHRIGLGLGFTLILVGIVGAGVFALYELWCAHLGLVPKLLITAFVAGFVTLFSVTYRARLRTLPYDSYTEVRR